MICAFVLLRSLFTSKSSRGHIFRISAIDYDKCNQVVLIITAPFPIVGYSLVQGSITTNNNI